MFHTPPEIADLRLCEQEVKHLACYKSIQLEVRCITCHSHTKIMLYLDNINFDRSGATVGLRIVRFDLNDCEPYDSSALGSKLFYYLTTPESYDPRF